MQEPIFFADRPFHCQVKLVMIDPKDGSYPRRMAATSARTGGLQFVSRQASGEFVMTQMHDSDARGRHERIVAKAREREEQYLSGKPGTQGRTRINLSKYAKIIEEAAQFVDSHPSA